MCGIVLTDFIQTSSGIVLHAMTKNRLPCCPNCHEPSHSVHDYRYRKVAIYGDTLPEQQNHHYLSPHELHE